MALTPKGLFGWSQVSIGPLVVQCWIALARWRLLCGRDLLFSTVKHNLVGSMACVSKMICVLGSQEQDRLFGSVCRTILMQR